jgi:hypothetical protein
MYINLLISISLQLVSHRIISTSHKHSPTVNNTQHPHANNTHHTIAIQATQQSVPLPNLSALASPSIHSNQGHPMHTSTPPRAPSQTRPVRLSLGATPTSAHTLSVHQASSATYFPHLCRNLPHAAGACHATARVREQGTCQVKFLAEVYSPINYLSLDPPARDEVSLRSQCYLEVCRIQEERGKVWKKS